MSDIPEQSEAPNYKNGDLLEVYKRDLQALEAELQRIETYHKQKKNEFSIDGVSWLEEQALVALQNMENEVEEKVEKIRSKIAFRTDQLARGGVAGPPGTPNPEDIPVVGTAEADTEFANSFKISLQGWTTEMSVAINDVRYAVEKQESSSNLKKLAGLVSVAIAIFKGGTALGWAIGVSERMAKLLGKADSYAKTAEGYSKALDSLGSTHEKSTKYASISSDSMNALFLDMKAVIEEVGAEWDEAYQNFARAWKTQNRIPVGQLVPRHEFKDACQNYANQNLPSPKDMEKALLLEALKLLKDDDLPLVGDFDGDGDLAGYVEIELSAYEHEDGSYEIAIEGKGFNDASPRLRDYVLATFREIGTKSIIHLPMKIRLSVYATHQAILFGTYSQCYQAWRHESDVNSDDFVAEFDRKKEQKNHALHNHIMKEGIVKSIRVNDLA